MKHSRAKPKATARKRNGLLVHPRRPPIPDQTRCEVCAEQHRQYREQARERARQQREQASGQTKIF